MRPSRTPGLTARAIACALVLALVVGAPAYASLAGASRAAALPTVQVQVGPILNVEANPLPKVDVAGLPTIEAPSLPKVEVPKVELPPTPPIETPTTPVEVPTPPIATTPIPAPTSSSGSPANRGGGSSGNDARTAAAGAPSGAGTKSTPAPKRRHLSASSRVGRPTAATHVATKRAGVKGSATVIAAKSAVTPSAPVALVGASGARHEHGASDPLTAIGRQIPFPVPVPDWSKPIILVLLALAVGFAVRSRRATLRARRLERQRASMLSDLDDLQAALVPAIPTPLGGLAVSVAYEPADGPAAGGDFYDLFELESGRVAIVVGDVVGHGRPALTQAALTRYTLRAYLQAGLEPRAALALASSVLAAPGEKRFATVVVAVHDSASGRLTYACAGHPAPIALGFDAPEPLSVCCSAPICCDLPTGLRQTTLSLPAGGRVCFFSDGLLEARAGEELLGRGRLSELAGGLGADISAPALLEQVRGEASETPDDMVACVIAPVGDAPAAESQLEELEVDRQMLAEPRVRAFLEACGLDPASVASLLARAGELADRDGTALLTVERRRSGTPAASVSTGRPGPDQAPLAADTTVPIEPALALPALP